MVIRTGIAGGNGVDSADNKEGGEVVVDKGIGVGSATGNVVGDDNPSTEIGVYVLESVDDFRRRVYRSAEYSGAEVDYSDKKLVP